MTDDSPLRKKQLAEILLYRLEKITADSPWAHRASGVKASLAKLLSKENQLSSQKFNARLKDLVRRGFEILEEAAGEIPPDGDHPN